MKHFLTPHLALGANPRLILSAANGCASSPNGCVNVLSDALYRDRNAMNGETHAIAGQGQDQEYGWGSLLGKLRRVWSRLIGRSIQSPSWLRRGGSCGEGAAAYKQDATVSCIEAYLVRRRRWLRSGVAGRCGGVGQVGLRCWLCPWPLGPGLMTA
ncbi:MAG: hypothetical protein MJA27_24465 [Pseudanabaenales cyanobacterium]|nr:hypothetical protein [Pseudanabaenales cyanobacterium]